MDSKGLSNEDFRKIMMTPRVIKQNTNEKKNMEVITDSKSKATNSKGKLKVKNKLKNKAKEIDDDDQLKEDNQIMEILKSRYRDRAEERRLGKTTFSDQLEAISSIYETISADNINDNKTETKFLYKKLDMVENKISDENEIICANNENNKLVTLKDQNTDFKSNINSLEKLSLLKIIQKDNNISGIYNKISNSELAKNISNFFTLNNKKNNTTKPLNDDNLFKTRRIAYEFNLDNNNNDSLYENNVIEPNPIPTVIIRSKNEHSKKKEISITTTQNIINKLYSILAYLRHEPSNTDQHNCNSTTNFNTFNVSISKTSNIACDKSLIKDGTSIYDDIGEYKLEDNLKSAERLKNQRNEILTTTYTQPISNISSINKETVCDDKNKLGLKNDKIKELNFTDSNALKLLASEAREAKYKHKIQNQEMNYMECYPENFNTSLSDIVYNNTKYQGKNLNYLQKDNKITTGHLSLKNQREKGSQTDKIHSHGSGSIRSNNKIKQKLDSEWNQISKLIEKRKSGQINDEEINNNEIAYKKAKSCNRDELSTPTNRRRRLM